MLNIQKLYKLALLLLLVVGMSFVFSGDAKAATMNVVAGTDDIATNGDCQLSEAIININDQAQTYPDCAAGDGNNDTIVLPAGTITLTNGLPLITEPLIMQGQGMGTSVINGDGAWSAINAADTFTGSGFTVTASVDIGLFLTGGAQLDRIEVDGTNWGIGLSGTTGGFVITNNLSGPIASEATNLYVHGFNVDSAQMIGVAVSGGTTQDMTATLSNITVSDITNTGTVQTLAVVAGLFDGGASSGGIDATIQNATVANIVSSDNIVLGFLTAGSTLDSAVINSHIENSTFVNLSGNGTSPFLGSFNNGVVLGVAGSAVTSITTNTSFRNLLIGGNNVSDCGTGNLNSLYSVSGAVVNNLTSLGGNTSDSSSCAAELDHASDQLGIAGLGATIGALSDNGGHVPTMPLLEGSPAVDAGVAVAGLTTDARLAARPQGNAFDSGAYESPYTRVLSKPESEPELADSGQNSIRQALLAITLLSTLTAAMVVAKKQHA